MIVGLWAILPLKQHFGLTWFNTYVQTFNTATRRFLQVGGVDVPATLSMTLIVALVAFLLLITVVLQLYPAQWPLCSVICLLYMFSMAAT